MATAHPLASEERVDSDWRARRVIRGAGIDHSISAGFDAAVATSPVAGRRPQLQSAIPAVASAGDCCVDPVVFQMNDIQGRIAASFASQRLMATLGAELAFVADGEVHIALPFAERLSQQHGYVHAGAITSIVDSACGYAALTRTPAGCEVVTAEFKINFLRPAMGDRFLAIGRVQNAGKLLTVCTGEVRAFVGMAYKVVAIIQATVATVRS